jgi:hypothetical protein
VLVGRAIVWEIAETVFWFRYTERIPTRVKAWRTTCAPQSWIEAGCPGS